MKLYVTESKIRHNCSNSVWLRACSTLISWKLEKPRVGGGQVQEGVGRVRGACAVEQLTLGFFPTYHMSKEISKDISLNVGIPRKSKDNYSETMFRNVIYNNFKQGKASQVRSSTS